jgi:hypothetical protein
MGIPLVLNFHLFIINLCSNFIFFAINCSMNCLSKPPPSGFLKSYLFFFKKKKKVIFDVVIRSNFSVAAAVISNDEVKP